MTSAHSQAQMRPGAHAGVLAVGAGSAGCVLAARLTEDANAGTYVHPIGTCAMCVGPDAGTAATGIGEKAADLITGALAHPVSRSGGERRAMSPAA